MEEEFLIRELLLSSTDSSSDSDEHLEVRGRGPIDPNARPKIQNYVENVVDRYTEEDFRNNFRMNRITFQDVLERVQDELSYGHLGRPKISPKTQLCIGLWYLATPDSYRSVCGRFGIGKATGLRTVRNVVEALFKLGPTVIMWPTGEKLQRIEEGFTNAGFPDTIGAIDGCHIAIPQPKENGLSYINRKNFASLILQGVCDNRMQFIHCYAGEVGSTHDSRVLKKSEVWQKLTTDRHTAFPNDRHIIGDKAYPCIQHLITPYRDNGHLTRAQREFNYKLSSARSVIERAFGLLKRRFRILKYFDIICLDWAPKYIIACCVLHNICLKNNDMIPEDIVEPPNNEPEDDNPNIDQAYHAQVQLGQQKRDRLCFQLYEELNE